MVYDFEVLKDRFWRSELTLVEFSRKTRPHIHYTTISLALRTGRASKKTAKAMCKVMGVEYAQIVPKRRPRAESDLQKAS